MDSLPSPPDEPDVVRDTIISYVLPWLEPSAVGALRTLSNQYDISVTKVEKDRLIAKRRVEEYIGFPVDIPDYKHDWKLTYELLTTDKSVLWFTGSEVDIFIATKLEVPKYDEDTIIDDIDNEITEGHAAAFRVLFQKFKSRLSLADYHKIISAGYMMERMWALDLPELLEAMATFPQDELERCLDNTLEFNISPMFLDFLLSNIPLSEREISYTYIYDMIIRGCYGYVIVFLKHGLIDVSITLEKTRSAFLEKDSNYHYAWNPIWLASKYGHLKVVKALLADESVKKIDPENFRFGIDTACERGYTEIVRALLESGIISPTKYDYPFRLSCENARTDIVRLLLSYPEIDPSTDGNFCLQVSVNDDETEIALMLLADPRLKLGSVKRDELMRTAKYHGNEQVMRALRLLDPIDN